MKKITTKKLIEFKKTKSKFPIIKELKLRFSPRLFKEEKISDKILNSMFEATRWAPSAYNYQPWYFYWTHQNTPAYKKMFSSLSERNQWAKTAPILIVACYLKEHEQKINRFAEYDLGLAVMSMITQAQSSGIHTRQMGLFDNKKLQKTLSIPKEYVPFIVLAVGKIGDYQKISQDLLERELQKRERKTNISKKL